MRIRNNTLGGFALTFLAIALSQCVALAQPSAPAPSPIGRLVDLGGYSLHVNATGKGSPAVVLISGAGDFSFDWALVQPEISRFSRCVSYDRSGLAWSDLGPTPRTMKQEAFELRTLLRKAGIVGPYVLVGHSIGGLIARTYQAMYPNDVSGIVLVDSTTEDTTLNYQGKLVRVRDSAKKRAIPAPRTLASSPPKPPTKADLEQIELNKKFFGEPKIEPPFDKLPSGIQELRLWALRNPKLAAQTDDYWAEELLAMHEARIRVGHPLGNIPLVVLIGGKGGGPPPGVAEEKWKKLSEEKRKQKMELSLLSTNSKLLVAEDSGHHIQIEQPKLVVSAVREVVESARTGKRLQRH